MQTRIKNIKLHKNYWVLRDGHIDEFKGIEVSLLNPTNKFLDKVERELERLSPGFRNYIVDGEEKEVRVFYTANPPP